jgi:hypothetical protein
MQGYLTKPNKSFGSKKWFFVLERCTLTYYENDTKAEKLAEITLNAETRISAAGALQINIDNVSVGAKTSDKTSYVLLCNDDPQKRDTWIAALKGACDLQHEHAFSSRFGDDRHSAEDTVQFVAKFKASSSLALSCAAISSAWHVHFMFRKCDRKVPLSPHSSHFVAMLSIQEGLLPPPPPPLPQLSSTEKMRQQCTFEPHSSSKAMTRTMLLRLKCFGVTTVLISKLALGARQSVANEREYDRHFVDKIAACDIKFDRKVIIIDRLRFKLQVICLPWHCRACHACICLSDNSVSEFISHE